MEQAEFEKFMSGPSDLQTRIPFRVSRLHNQFQAYTKRLLRDETGLGLSEWRMMVVIGTQGPCFAADIVRQTALDKAQVSKALKKLEAKGLIDQNQDTDARRRHLTLSDAGRRLFERAAPIMNARRQHLIKGLKEDQLATFFTVIEHMEGQMK